MQLCVEEIIQCDGQTAGLDRDLVMFSLDRSDWLCIQLAQFVLTDISAAACACAVGQSWEYSKTIKSKVLDNG